MILVDLNQVTFSTIALEHFKDEISEDLLRHIILNCIRSYRVKFKDEWGEIVVCSDSRKYWRKEVFPFYKAHRKKVRDESGLDWAKIFECMDKVKGELKTSLPYKYMEIDGAEADDIISVLSKHLDKSMIISSDKDFIQLHSDTVKQYDPLRKRWISHPDPSRYLIEHIIKGDAGDGIPNIKMVDNAFVAGIRQSPIRQTFIDEVISFLNTDMKGSKYERNYLRNKQLIDLTMIPENIKIAIIKDFDEQPAKDRSNLFGYFMSANLKHLMISINEF